MILVAAVMLSMTTAMAESKNADAKTTTYTNVYDFNVNTYSLAKSLNANQDQYEKMADIYEVFHTDMRRAGYSRKAKRQERVDAAIKRNLGMMKSILDEQQYKKYLMVLNATMLNRGLK